MCAARCQFLRQGRANPGTRAGDQRPLSTPGAVHHDGNVAPGFKSVQGMVTANDTLVVRYTSCKRAAVRVVFATFQLSQVSFSATSAHRENLKTTAKYYCHMKIAIPAPFRRRGPASLVPFGADANMVENFMRNGPFLIEVAVVPPAIHIVADKPSHGRPRHDIAWKVLPRAHPSHHHGGSEGIGQNRNDPRMRILVGDHRD